ncbi:MAG TPA: hypothetical protein VFB41_03010 [Solirubrobacteraceae bacterium]|nr:hypothetical protein [Solirubrobacteraceae bacterium]
MTGDEKYWLWLRVADDRDDTCLYVIEHWFADKPHIETIRALFEEAKRDYALLYPDEHAADFSVELRRLRPTDNHRPDFPLALDDR